MPLWVWRFHHHLWFIPPEEQRHCSTPTFTLCIATFIRHSQIIPGSAKPMLICHISWNIFQVLIYCSCHSRTVCTGEFQSNLGYTVLNGCIHHKPVLSFISSVYKDGSVFLERMVKGRDWSVGWKQPPLFHETKPHPFFLCVVQTTLCLFPFIM